MRQKEKNFKPPALATTLLKKVVPEEEQTFLEGDFKEIYKETCETRGRVIAGIGYWYQVLGSLPHFFRNYLSCSISMLSNYITITLRSLLKQKGYSLINILGLALGMASFLLITFWVQEELGADGYHDRANRIYRVVYEDHTGENITHGWRTAPALAPALKNTFPDIQNSTRWQVWRNTLIKEGNNFFKEKVGLGDPSITDMFTLKFIRGDKKSAFKQPNSILITEGLAKKIYGDRDPLRNTILLENKIQLQITGIIEDLPVNSQIHCDCIANFSHILRQYWNQEINNIWRTMGYHTYILLQRDAIVKNLNAKISGFNKKNAPDINIKLYLQPLKNIRLHKLGGGGAITYVYTFSLVGIFILLIACINFMNLTTARSARRYKEIGLRKVVGASRKGLIRQFIGESVMMSFLALILTVFLIILLQPVLFKLSSTPFSGNPFSSGNILLMTVVALVTGLVAGCYPALYMSSFSPAKLFRSFNQTGKTAFRRTLVVIQFTLSIGLIICTLTVFNQLSFMKKKSPGFEKEGLLYLTLQGDLNKGSDSIKHELLRSGYFSHITRSSVVIGTETNYSGVKVNWEGKSTEKNPDFHVVTVDYDFFKTFKMTMVEGRPYSSKLATDKSNFVINQEAARKMGLSKPVGTVITAFNNRGKIIGVVRDFHLRSLHHTIKPMIFTFNGLGYYQMICRIKNNQIQRALGKLKQVSKKFAPDFPEEIHFLDKRLEELYQREEKVSHIFAGFAILAIFISCMGLLGLVSYVTEQRTKEIGIRKVVGAPTSKILLLLSKEFMAWVLAANLFAWPLAFLIIKNWLNQFAFHIHPNPLIFALTAFITLIVAQLTVSFQTMRASRISPVVSLKGE